MTAFACTGWWMEPSRMFVWLLFFGVSYRSVSAEEAVNGVTNLRSCGPWQLNPTVARGKCKNKTKANPRNNQRCLKVTESCF